MHAPSTVPWCAGRQAPVCVRAPGPSGRSRRHGPWPAAAAAAGPAEPAPDPLQAYVAERPWARAMLELHEHVKHEMGRVAEATGGPLLPAPTRHSGADARFTTTSLDGRSSYTLQTCRGGAIAHMNSTQGVVPAIGLVYAKVTAHACMEQGTPFLDVELTGMEGKGVLVALVPTPRLNPMLHPDFLVKYWRSPLAATPASSSTTATTSPPLTFEGVERRVRGRMPPAQGFGAPLAGAPPATAPLYHDFVSASLWSRLAAAPGILFSFDPLDPAALACAREDISDVLRLWAGWVARDAGAGPLGGDAAGECRALTEAAARFLKYDPDVGRVEALMGSEAVRKMMETVSGEAVTGSTPWWLR